MNYNYKQFETRPTGRAVTSLALGIISVGFTILAYYFPIPGISMFIFGGASFIALVGIILGIIGLKSTKKNIALLLGIILCISVFLVSLKHTITLWRAIEAISS